MPLSYDPDFAKVAAPLLSARASRPPPGLHDTEARRGAVPPLFASIFAKLPDAVGIEVTKYQVKSYDGQFISVHRFWKKDSHTAPGPGILHCFGGGTIMGDVNLIKKPLSLQVQQTGIQIFSVDYRLAPENPHPTPSEDCYAGLCWLYEHADEFAVDRKKIAVMGQSAGGQLSAAIALMARDRGLSPPLAKQILIYPMLDDRNTAPHTAVEPLATWGHEDNITAWTALLGNKIGTNDISPYAAPARVKSVEGLPPTYIDVGELDIFRDEDIAYATRIAAANISLELHVYPGVPHIFEVLASDSEPAKRAMANRMKAVMDLWT